MPRRWKRLREQYDRLRVETDHIMRGLELPRTVRGFFTRDLHPELSEHYARLKEEIARALDDPRSRPNLAAIDARPTSEQAFVDSVATVAGIDRAEAYASIVAVFEVLRDRLPADECQHLARWLPGKLRRLIQKPKREGVLRIRREEFVDRVSRHLGVDVAQAILRIRAVYAVLERAIAAVAPDEPAHISRRMPHDLRVVLHLPSESAPAQPPP